MAIQSVWHEVGGNFIADSNLAATYAQAIGGKQGRKPQPVQVLLAQKGNNCGEICQKDHPKLGQQISCCDGQIRAQLRNIGTGQK